MILEYDLMRPLEILMSISIALLIMSPVLILLSKYENELAAVAYIIFILLTIIGLSGFFPY